MKTTILLSDYMKHVFSKQLQDYVQRVCDLSSLDESTIEKVINTQIAILLGDLAVTQESETFVGKIKLNSNNKVQIDISKSIQEMIDGKINPLQVLMEILNA